MKLERLYVYDFILRLCHWGLAFFCILLLGSAWAANFFEETGLYRKAFWIVHIFSGYGLIFFLSLRIFWGLIGPAKSRLKDLWKWKDWIEVARTKSLKVRWSWGHHPLAALSYIAFYVALLVLSGTGVILAAIEHNQGPFAEQFYDEVLLKRNFDFLHEASAWFVVIFIITHLFALIWHEKHDEIPVAQSMVSGYQYRKKTKEDNS